MRAPGFHALLQKRILLCIDELSEGHDGVRRYFVFCAHAPLLHPARQGTISIYV